MHLRDLWKPDVLWGVGVLLLLSVPFALSDLDLSLSAVFYNQIEALFTLVDYFIQI